MALEWREVTLLELRSGLLSVTDPMLYPGLQIELFPGTYRVSVGIQNVFGEQVVARLRVILPGAAVTSAAHIGEVVVDFGQVTVGDSKEMEVAGNTIRTPEDAQTRLDILAQPGQFGFVPWDLQRETTTPYVRTPEGDGEFSVFRLHDHEMRPVGVEIVFVDE